MTALLKPLVENSYKELKEDVKNVLDHVGTYLRRNEKTKHFSYYHYVLALEDVGNSLGKRPILRNDAIRVLTWYFTADYKSRNKDRKDKGKFEDGNYQVAFEYLLANFAELSPKLIVKMCKENFKKVNWIIEGNNGHERNCYSFCVGKSGIDLNALVARFKRDGIIDGEESKYDYWIDTETNTVSFYRIPQDHWEA